MAGKSNFLVRGGADFSGIKREIQKTQATMSAFQVRTSKTMAAVGKILGAVAVGKLIKDSTAAAMGVESAMDNISRNMKNSSAVFQDWVNTQSKALGMGKAEAYKYGSIFSNLLGSFQDDAKETADSTQELMKAAAIISSKTGRTYEDTANRIRSGLLGSTEAIEDLGVYTNISMIESTAAFKKFAGSKSWAQLDFQTQQQIRLAAILEQTYARYGNTLADTTTTRQNQFTASLKNAQLALGQAFLPIYNAVLPALTRMAEALGAVINRIAQFSQALFGKANVGTVQNTEEQAAALSGLGDASESAGKQAKKAQSALAGFDELNVLSKPADVGVASGAVTTSAPVVDGLSGEIGSNITVSPKIAEFTEKIKGLFEPLKDIDFDNLNKALENLKQAAAPLVETLFKGLEWAVTNVFIPLAKITIENVIPTFLNALALAMKGLNAVLENAKPIITGIAVAFGAWKLIEFGNYVKYIGALTSTTGFAALSAAVQQLAFTGFATLKTHLISVVDSVKALALNMLSAAKNAGLLLIELVKQSAALVANAAKWVWSKTVMVASTVAQVAMTAATVAWNVVCGIATVVTSAFAAAIAFLTSPIGLVIVAVAALVAGIALLAIHWDEVKEAGVKALEWIKQAWNKAGEWFNTTVVEPIKTFFSGLWETIKLKALESWTGIKNIWQVVSEWFNTTIILPVTTFFTTLKESIVTLFSDAWTTVKETWAKASNWFKDNVITPISNAFKAGINFLIGLAEGFANGFIKGINSIIDAINKIQIDVPGWLEDLTGMSTFGFNIPRAKTINIPRLATGGITDVNNPFMAVVGDNRTQKEVISPLDDLLGMITSAVNNASGQSGNGNNGDIYLTVKIGEDTFIDKVVTGVNRQNRINGRTVMEV